MEIRSRVRIIGAERAQLAQLVAGRYRSGESIRVLAASIGQSYGFTHALLEEAGAVLRDRGSNHRPHRAKTGASE
ncbi:transcriptional regulator [Nonomuraea turkmeniaca]|uniref:Transcriptional regulator n=1 Tax=Nonomuraea turkmeniaca TaxID=103838 RepID=A0A5S4F2M0_9ACTN|nr:helix-turn-helix domain-containing protein [Nonomuraea turkmeniaca]TMR10242.1 transcriptional regulator [Nonomuraea turkmeniaca]